MRLAVKTLLLILALAAIASAQTQNFNITTKYDRFTDQTTVEVVIELIPGVVDLGGGSVYVPQGTGGKSAKLIVVGGIKGRDIEKSIPEVHIVFLSVSSDWLYLKTENTMRVILDGKDRLTIGTMKRVGSKVLRTGNRVIEELDTGTSFPTIERLARGNKVEIQIGISEFELKPEHIQDLKKWIERFPTAQSKP